MHRFTRFFLLLIVLLGGASFAPLQAMEVRPPFGLKWGDTSDNLAGLLKNAGAKIVQKRTINGQDVWTVEGLLQPRLKRTLFYFRDSTLIEIELQYEEPTWSVTQYDSFLGELRRRIELTYGPGTMIARQKAPTADVTETIVGYQWNLDNGSLQLFYFSAEKDSNVYRSVSVHYKAG